MRAKRTRSTTILTVRRGDRVAIGGDGQVTMGNAVVKGTALKIRKLQDGKVMVGFAGSTADALALLERFDAKLSEFQGNVPKAATQLAKEWRTDKLLRRLESLMVVVDRDHSFLLGGAGEVIQPDDGIIGIGSGGNYAAAAAKALVRSTELSASEIVSQALVIASEICVYTNDNIVVEEL